MQGDRQDPEHHIEWIYLTDLNIGHVYERDRGASNLQRFLKGCMESSILLEFDPRDFFWQRFVKEMVENT